MKSIMGQEPLFGRDKEMEIIMQNFYVVEGDLTI
jgi:hypothetical protein